MIKNGLEVYDLVIEPKDGLSTFVLENDGHDRFDEKECAAL